MTYTYLTPAEQAPAAPPAAAVPEPATWTLLVGGFGLIGATMRRRQRTAVDLA